MLNESTTTTNSTTMKLPENERIFVAVALIVLSTIGVSFYSFVLHILIWTKNHFNNAFYKLAVVLGCLDCSFMIQTAVYGSICILKEGDHWVSLPFRLLMSWTEHFLFYFQSYQMVYICINRYIAVAHFSMYVEAFRTRNIVICTMLIFVLSAMVPAIYIGCNCHVAWSLYSWGLRCSSRIKCEVEAATLAGVVANIPVAALPAIYFIIFLRVKKAASQVAGTISSTADAVRERALMIQFSLISAVRFTKQATFWFLFKITTPRLATGVISLFLLIDLNINPILYVIFSSEIRTKLFRPKTNVNNPATAIPLTSFRLKLGSVKENTFQPTSTAAPQE